MVEPSIARPPVVAPRVTTTLSTNCTTATSTATAETPQLTARPNQGTCHCKQQAHPQPPRTVPVRSPRSLHRYVLCVPRSACSWNVHHSVEKLNQRYEELDKLQELPLHDHRPPCHASSSQYTAEFCSKYNRDGFEEKCIHTYPASSRHMLGSKTMSARASSGASSTKKPP